MRRRRVCRRRQAVEPSTSYTVGRVRREFANQSSIGVMLTATNRKAAGHAAVPRPTAPTPAASTGTRASRSATASPATSRRAACTASPTRSIAFRRTAATTSSVPTPALHARRSARTVAQAAQRADRHQQNRRRAHPLQLERRVQVARLRHQRRRVPAPRRPAHHRQLVPVPQRQAEPLVPQPQHQLQPVRRVELRRRSAGQRFNVNGSAHSSTTGRPAAASTPTSSPPTTA